MKQIIIIITLISLITIQPIAAKKKYKIKKKFEIINDSSIENKQLILNNSYVYFIDTVNSGYELLDCCFHKQKIKFIALDKEKNKGIFKFFSPYGIDTIIPVESFLSKETLFIRRNKPESKIVNPYFNIQDTIFEGKSTISGNILELNKEAAIGATVRISGTSIGTITDPNGFFEIKDIPNGPISLECNYIGSLSKTIPLILTENSTVKIVLDEDPNQNELDEVVLTGKPAIYLYPTQEQEINIQLDFKGQLKTTFPKYNDGWTVIAKPNGELTNLTDNRKYNYLFWDGWNKFPTSHFDYKDGLVVKKSDLDKFLIEKLSHLGLNNTEINDFVVYWLPQLEKNEYNLIHFFINDNIDNTAFLNMTPKPDTEIRVYMEFKAVNKDYKIKEQQLPKIERKGFTLVEWGGGIIGSGKIE